MWSNAVFSAGTETDVAQRPVSLLHSLCLGFCGQPDLLCTSVCLPLTSLGRSLRHSQERHRHRRHVRHEARAHHEVHHPRRHGGYHSHLRIGGRRADCQQHCREARPPQVSPAHVWLRAVALSFLTCPVFRND